MPTPNQSISETLAPVYLELGKAVYICQCFESSLCLLLATMAHESSRGEVGAFEASWDFHSKKTLGQLLNALREQIEVPEEVDEFLGEGVDKRNEIVHGFLTKNANLLAEPKERLRIEQELVHLKKEVKRRDVVVNRLLDALLKKYDLSNAILKQDFGRLWDHMNPQDSEDEGKPSH
jgi:hypothetical protein